ncbi:hypothetical protein BJ138DRAFT_1109169 [Hygrophoropsis aurantiaca]|uniref:Uncharacterized protein n=1 Tax=Hygrophoropsis aurantiaca TaxID=72124 RepID=A0ACB8ARL9_9AGAM|nr:hypothetical protein BJ138DRAFT_1109169 [Hygrophoropsis aurantiaca]
MPRFLTADELGNIKSVRYLPTETSEQKCQTKTLYDGSTGKKKKSTSKLAFSADGDTKLLAAGYNDGSISLFDLKEDDQIDLLRSWRETRMQVQSAYVGLSACQRTTYSCTSSGALRATTIAENDSDSLPTHRLGALPTRLCDWRLSHNQETFAYAGDEVELSLWNTEKAFVSDSTEGTTEAVGKKRKRGEQLLPGEIWRAKNVPNDNLGLRQPVHNTCLTYLYPSPVASTQHLLACTRLGDVRRYDTRAGKRPISDWKGIGKEGGVKAVEKGFREHELFVSDQASHVFALDLRNGGVAYGYKGISGTVTSLVSTPTHLASISLDRYTRIHSTFSLPDQLGQQQEEKGMVLEKVFMTTTPTVIVWDQESDALVKTAGGEEGAEADEDVWDGMKNVGDSDDDGDVNKNKPKRKAAKTPQES